MASRYLFKVEYAENRFCSFFLHLVDLTDYSFVKLTNDIKQHVRALQIITPNTVRIRFRDEGGDYVNLPYGDKDMFLEMFKSGKLVHDRHYVKIHLKVSELDSPMGMPTHISKEKQLRHEVPDIKPPQKHNVKPVVVDDDDSDSRIAVSKTKSRQTTAVKGIKQIAVLIRPF